MLRSWWPRGWVPLTLGALIALAGCTASDPASNRQTRPDDSPPGRSAVSEPPSGNVTVADGPVEVPHVRGRRFYNTGDGGFERLRGRVHAPFSGALSPAAVLDPATDTRLAYNSWRRGAPVIRLHDLATGEDRVVEEGAFSLAWGRDRGLAYFKGTNRRVRDPDTYRGHVLVRSSPGARPTRWTREPARYVVAAWAQDSLLVYRYRQGYTDVLVLDGPGQVRLLAASATLVALSPDGSSAFVADRPDPRPSVRVVALGDREDVARLPLSGLYEPTTRRPLSYVAYSGSWTDELVVASVSGGIGVFRVDGEDIRVEQLLRLDPDVFPVGVTEPRGDESGRYIVASVEIVPAPQAAVNQTALIECDRLRLACELGRPAPYVQPPRFLYNPSRP